MTLTDAIGTLAGVRIGRRMLQVPAVQDFILDERCPVAVVREFLGGLFGADGHAPVLHRWGRHEDEATLEPPAYSQSAIPAHVERLKQLMDEVIQLLARCGVQTDGARVYAYSTRRAASTYPAAQDGLARVEVRLALPAALSFVERVRIRSCAHKALQPRAVAQPAVRYCGERGELAVPAFGLVVGEQRLERAGPGFGVAVDALQAFVAAAVVVNNCVNIGGAVPDAVVDAATENEVVV